MSTGRSRASLVRLDALTGLRFLAALHVVCIHFFPWAWMASPGPVRNIVTSGFVAVSFFYVLSGFILTYTHAGDAPSPSGRRAFYVARIARIAPVYYLALLGALPFFVSATLKRGHVARALLEAVSLLTFTNAYDPRLAMALWNPAAWSLSVEAFFYALFPFVVPMVLRQPPRRALVLMGAMWLVSIAPPCLLLLSSADPRVDPDGPFTFFGLIRYNPFFRLPEFIAGCALGSIFRRQPERPRGVAGVAAFAGAALLVVLAAADRIPYMLLNSTGLLVPLYAALIFALAYGQGLLAKVLGSAVLVRLGEASYSLYTLQFATWFWLSKLATTLGHGAQPGSPGFFVFYLLITLAVTLVVHQTVEIPLRTWVRRVLGGTAPRGA